MNSELMTYIQLKYFPVESTSEYLDKLPMSVRLALHNDIFGSEVSKHATLYGIDENELRRGRLIYALSRWNDIAARCLVSILIAYYMENSTAV